MVLVSECLEYIIFFRLTKDHLMLLLWNLVPHAWLLTHSFLNSIRMFLKAGIYFEFKFWWQPFETVVFRTLFDLTTFIGGYFLLMRLTSRFRVDHPVVFHDGVINWLPLTLCNAWLQMCLVFFSAFWSHKNVNWGIRIIVGSLCDLILLLDAFIDWLPYIWELKLFLFTIKAGSLWIPKYKFDIIRISLFHVIGVVYSGLVGLNIKIVFKFEITAIFGMNIPSRPSFHSLIFFRS